MKSSMPSLFIRSSLLQSFAVAGILAGTGIGFVPEVRAERFPGKSIGSEVLQRDIYNAIEPFDGASRPGCTTRGMKVVDTELVSPPPKDAKVANGVFTSGSWVERWSTQNCNGPILKYLVTFTADGKGGTDYSIKADR